MEKLERDRLGATQLGAEIAGNLASNVGQALRYSSPLPWILALAIGTSMWGFLAWLILQFMR
jgi:hypothetical protein